MMCACADGLRRGTDACHHLLLEKSLRQAIFKRMERDDGEPATRSQEVDCLRQRRRERLELAVDGDAERLEDAGGRVDPPASPDGAFNQSCQLRRGVDAAPSPLLHNGPRDAARMRLLPAGEEKPGELRRAELRPRSKRTPSTCSQP